MANHSTSTDNGTQYPPACRHPTCRQGHATHPTKKDLNVSATTYQLTVKGMSCQHCVKAVTAAVQALDADATVNVDLAQQQVTVQTTLSREATAAAIAEEGYEVQA